MRLRALQFLEAAMFGYGFRAHGWFCLDCEKRFGSFESWHKHEYLSH